MRRKSVPRDWISACEQNTRCSEFGQVSREFLWEGVPISARNRKKSARNQVGNQLEQEAWVHETKSEFVEGRGERCTKSSRNSSGKGESGRTKPSRNSSRRWRRCRTKPSRNSAKAGERRCTKSNRISPERSPLIGAGEGEAFFPRCGVKPFAQKMTIYLKLRSLRWSVRSIACLTWCTNFQCCARARCGGKRDRAVCRQMYVLCVRGFWRADRLTGLREQRIHL